MASGKIQFEAGPRKYIICVLCGKPIVDEQYVSCRYTDSYAVGFAHLSCVQNDITLRRVDITGEKYYVANKSKRSRTKTKLRRRLK